MRRGAVRRPETGSSTRPSPASKSGPRASHFDGIVDGTEDKNRDGLRQPNETSATTQDTDRDGLKDGEEDFNHNGVKDWNETNPLVADTDGDGLTELVGTDSDPDCVHRGTRSASYCGGIPARPYLSLPSTALAASRTRRLARLLNRHRELIASRGGLKEPRAEHLLNLLARRTPPSVRQPAKKLCRSIEK